MNGTNIVRKKHVHQRIIGVLLTVVLLCSMAMPVYGEGLSSESIVQSESEQNKLKELADAFVQSVNQLPSSDTINAYLSDSENQDAQTALADELQISTDTDLSSALNNAVSEAQTAYLNLETAYYEEYPEADVYAFSEFIASEPAYLEAAETLNTVSNLIASHASVEEDNISTAADAEYMGKATGDVNVFTDTSKVSFKLFDYTNLINYANGYDTSTVVEESDYRDVVKYFRFRGVGQTGDVSEVDSANSIGNAPGFDTDTDGFKPGHVTVMPTLDSNGYPVLDLETTENRSITDEERGITEDNPLNLNTTFSETQRSLAYLFGGTDSEGVEGAVIQYTPANTLLEYDANTGYYEYNSAINATDYDTTNNLFRVRQYAERGSDASGFKINNTSQPCGDFLPFNYCGDSNGTATAIGKNATTNIDYHYNQTDINFWFGMTMNTSFIQPKDGQVSGNNMKFEFSGDDDVWVFVDGVLVLDLGGTHGITTGSIDFSTGKVEAYIDWDGVDGSKAKTYYYPTTLYEGFEKAGRTDSVKWTTKTVTDSDGNTSEEKVFLDNTTHTLTYFYLERATSCSNCHIKFNLQTIPKNSVSVTKEVEGLNDALAAEQEYAMQLFVKGVNDSEYKLFTGSYTCGEEEKVIGADGIFKLKKDETAVFQIEDDSQYYVKELNAAGNYDVSFTHGTDQPASGTIEGTDIKSSDYTMSENVSDNHVSVKNTVKPYSLKVNKTFSGAGLTGAPEDFGGEFSIYKADEDGNKTGNALQTVSYEDFENDSYTFTGLLPGKYVIEETGADVFSTELNIVYVGTEYSGNPAEISSSAIPEVTVKNTYQYKTKELTISKNVTGNMADITKEFEFELTLKDSNQNSYTDTLPCKNYRQLSELSATDGKYIFHLKDDEKITITIPYGFEYTIKETSAEGYETSINNTLDEDREINGILTEDSTVAYTNNRTVLVDTGIDSNILLFGKILTGVIVLLAGCVIIYVCRRKRRI